MTTLKHLSFAALAGLASGNFVSPGLKKCMTAVFPNFNPGQQDVALTPCTTSQDQDFGVQANGNIMALSKRCLRADDVVRSSKVHLTSDCQSDFTHWELTKDGYVKLAGTQQCLDVVAKEKTDGTRETWDEIILHPMVDIQLYDCHSVCTSRVNQLWAWAAITGDDFGVANVQNSQLGDVSGQLVSPGLAKCLSIGAGIMDVDADGMPFSPGVNVLLADCTDGFWQNFQIADGVIKVPKIDKCLMADSAQANANVYLGDCNAAALADFKWELTATGNIRLATVDLCMDVQALTKGDGSRENFTEIKTHATVNVILYDCHLVGTTRVNQQWEWSPIQPDAMGHRPGCAQIVQNSSKPLQIVQPSAKPIQIVQPSAKPLQIVQPSAKPLQIVQPSAKPLQIVAPGGSMPLNVGQANQLAAILNNYAIGLVHMSSAAALASVASAAVLGAAAASAFAHRRRASVAVSESLMVAEE